MGLILNIATAVGLLLMIGLLLASLVTVDELP